MAVAIRGESDRLAVARPDRCGIVCRASRERLSEPSPCRDQKKVAFETERDRFPVRRDRGIAQPKRLRIRSERFVRLSVREAGDRAKQCRTKRDGQSQQSLIHCRGKRASMVQIRMLAGSARSFFLHQLSDGAFELEITPFGCALRII